MKLLIVLLTVWLGIASAAEPQRNLGISPASGEKRVALVIGNSAYKDAPLKNPVNDAKDMAATLRRLGFDVIEKTNVSQKDINRAIAQFGEKLRADTVALFFYAGHGMQVKGKNYIIPIDAHITGEATVRAEAVDVDTVMDQLAISPMNIVILDACRNNPFERKFRSTSGGLAQMDAPKGSLIAYATAPGKTAADGESRNGLYTQELLKHIQTPGLPLETVFKRVRNGVMAASGEAQTPWEASSLTGEFFFRPVAGATSVTAPQIVAPVDLTAVEVSFWESIKNSTDAEDYQAYLDKYPSGQFVALAERRVKKKKTKTEDAASTSEVAPGDAFKDCADCPEMVIIPAGSFEMGGAGDNEKPIHRVVLKGFALGRTEVTQGQWKAVMGNNPSGFKDCGDDCPVEKVNWDEAREFAHRLSKKTGKTYRLPSEAEWEYACRAGGKQTYCGGEATDSVAWTGNSAGISWFASSSGNQTHAVARKQANAWGLHDMSGNVWEWTEDCWNASYVGAPGDGSAWLSGDCGQRVLRGGSWLNPPQVAGSAVRSKMEAKDGNYIIGFRLLRKLEQDPTQPIGIVRPETTRGLDWAESDNGADINWHEAKQYCANKGSGWRLPSVAELQSNYNSGQPTSCGILYRCRVASKSNLTGQLFWSNEPNGPSQAWNVYLGDGTGDRSTDMMDSRGRGKRALCVRRP
ncbi:MAG: SUMF1/EgtB/PvdO family nonheme iron enzyme [Sulfuritalea sp.]|nr:SUMF1/EgtB/PvdO family nonheme iron enzyme [Sulfuritalea sp.]